ncbi:putative zinc finger CCHC domain-containing protein 10-like [Apostichopus japonicus]|uniref:Putative zinc finger CCHC domain-containing protein 10-like n=1 Tax=Stichopus japonicus TaxID=307972 RepID=A0A2G8LEY9_STIJA|nr:putative zinc finger CCHC domain-containing protein 10-like [Apostichopus japonicus]
MDSAKSAPVNLKENSVRVFDKGYSYTDLVKSIHADVGNQRIIGCVKSSGQWIVTLKNGADAELIQETGLEIKGEYSNVVGVEKTILTVSRYGIPSYIEDAELSSKLEGYGCLVKTDWTRNHHEEFPEIENGIRYARVQMPTNAKNLPYAVTIDNIHMRVKHNDQIKVCNNCLSEKHTMKECPKYICRLCGKQGHAERRCPKVKCFRCQQFGHKSFDCTEEVDPNENDLDAQDTMETNSETPDNAEKPIEDNVAEVPTSLPTNTQPQQKPPKSPKKAKATTTATKKNPTDEAQKTRLQRT